MIRRRFAFRTAGSAGRTGGSMLVDSHRRPGTRRVCLRARGARRPATVDGVLQRLDDRRRRPEEVRRRGAPPGVAFDQDRPRGRERDVPADRPEGQELECRAIEQLTRLLPEGKLVTRERDVRPRVVAKLDQIPRTWPGPCDPYEPARLEVDLPYGVARLAVVEVVRRGISRDHLQAREQDTWHAVAIDERDDTDRLKRGRAAQLLERRVTVQALLDEERGELRLGSHPRVELGRGEAGAGPVDEP